MNGDKNWNFTMMTNRSRDEIHSIPAEAAPVNTNFHLENFFRYSKKSQREKNSNRIGPSQKKERNLCVCRLIYHRTVPRARSFVHPEDPRNKQPVSFLLFLGQKINNESNQVTQKVLLGDDTMIQARHTGNRKM